MRNASYNRGMRAAGDGFDGGPPMGGGFNSRPAPYDSRDRYGGPNRYNSMGGRGRKYNVYRVNSCQLS